MDLAEEIYRLTDLLPDGERYGLVTQMQRSAVSIPSNIAEGHSRSHAGDFLKHLSYARGSLSELETQLTLAVRTGRLPREQAITAWECCQDVGRMLTQLIKKPGR
ncbi:MAG: four helix bundle protein [Planctomycetota bacterium]